MSNKRNKKPQPLHVLPNQSKHPKVGDNVMIGIAQPEKQNKWKSASVIQVTPARHEDQSYRFKWQLVAEATSFGDTNLDQKNMLSGWTNEHQRVHTRDSKLDDRIATHTSFDFVRHCDILEITKFDIERKLYKELFAAPSNTQEKFDSTQCVVCNMPLVMEDVQEDMQDVQDVQQEQKKPLILPCCHRPFHPKCEQILQTKIMKGMNENEMDKEPTTSSTIQKDMTCCFCKQKIEIKTIQEIVARDLQRAKEGHLVSQVDVAMRYANGLDGVEQNDAIARMLLEKTSEAGDLRAAYSLGFFYFDGRAGLDSISPEKRIEIIKKLWTNCAANGFTLAQEKLDAFFPSKEMQEERERIQYAQQLEATIAKMEKNKIVTKEERRAEIVKKLAEAKKNATSGTEEKKTVEKINNTTNVMMATTATSASTATVTSSTSTSSCLTQLMSGTVEMAKSKVVVGSLLEANNTFKRGAPKGSPPGQCPQGHGLSEFKAKQHSCDRCRTNQKLRAQMYGCDLCDWDVCKKCSKEYFKKEGKFQTKASKVVSSTIKKEKKTGKQKKAERKAMKAEMKAVKEAKEAEEMKAAKIAKEERKEKKAAKALKAANAANAANAAIEGETKEEPVFVVKGRCTNCNKAESPEFILKACTCLVAQYCPGGKCQKKNWKIHKAIHKQKLLEKS